MYTIPMLAEKLKAPHRKFSINWVVATISRASRNPPLTPPRRGTYCAYAQIGSPPRRGWAGVGGATYILRSYAVSLLKVIGYEIYFWNPDDSDSTGPGRLPEAGPADRGDQGAGHE